MSTTQPKPETRSGFRPVLLLPLIVFAALAGIFLYRLETGGDIEAIPSALIGKPAPAFDLPPLEGSGLPGLKRADLDGKVSVVNIFASWCAPCRLEHPQITALSKDARIRVVGINNKDVPENALRFLGEFGNPYAAIGVDTRGRTSIDWGAYAVPETFIVGADGVILYKFIGPIDAEVLDKVVRPEIEKALQVESQ